MKYELKEINNLNHLNVYELKHLVNHIPYDSTIQSVEGYNTLINTHALAAILQSARFYFGGGGACAEPEASGSYVSVTDNDL